MLRVPGEHGKYPDIPVLEGAWMGNSQSAACHVPWDILQSLNVSGEEWEFSLLLLSLLNVSGF